nr:BTAD domain-containing putative transcriptional regulator [Streptomyces canus]
MAVQISVLGDIRVLIDGNPVELGPPRRQCVLAGLLIDANRVVSSDRLADRVWSGRPPDGARQILHSYLSRLRRAFLPAGERVAIERRPSGYVLALRPGVGGVADVTVDLHRFRDLLDRARGAADDGERAAALLDEALGLWHGHAFASLESPWLDEVRAHLDEERFQAELERGDLLLRQGRQARLLVELQSRVGERPLNERLVGQLMLTLYREGRSAHALEEYERLRRDLADTMGADPGPELRRLHLRILDAKTGRSDDQRSPAPALVPTARPGQLPLPPSSLAGRAQELAALDDIQRSDTVPVTVICGLGGVGKTSLALRWAHDNLHLWPDGQLHANLRGFAPTVRPLTPQAVIRGFLTALGVDRRAVPTDFEAQTGLYRSLVAGKRILILLDNVRDAEQVRPLLPGSPSCTVLITSRNRLSGLVAAEGALPVVLEPLTTPEAHRLLADRLGDQRVAAEPEAATALISKCGGLPLALAVACARAMGNPQFPLAALAAELRPHETRLDALDTGDLSTSLRAAFDSSYGALDGSAARLLCLLGLAPGQDIGLPAAASLAGLPPTRTGALLRALEDAHLVQQHAPGRYGLHDLVRLYAAERATRDQSPAQLTEALSALIGFYVRTADRAHSLMAPHGTSSAVAEGPKNAADTAGAQESASSGGPVPLGLDDSATATEWFDAERSCLLAVLQLAVSMRLHSQVWRLCWDTTLFLRRSGDVQELLGVSETGLAAAQALDGPTAPTLQAMAHRGLAFAMLLADRDGSKLLDHLGRALSLSEDTGDLLNQAHTHQGLVMALDRADAPKAALKHAERSLELYERAGDPHGEANALNTLGWCQGRVGHYEEAAANCHKSLEASRTYGWPHAEAAVLDTLGHVNTQAGRHSEAVGYFRQALDAYRNRRDAYEVANTFSGLAEAHHALGEYAEARTAWNQALTLYRAQHRTAQAEETENRLGAGAEQH